MISIPFNTKYTEISLHTEKQLRGKPLSVKEEKPTGQASHYRWDVLLV